MIPLWTNCPIPCSSPVSDQCFCPIHSKNETTTDYSSEYSIYSINSAELTDKEIATLGTKEGYVYLIAGENQSIVSANANSSELTAKVDAYYNVNFNSSNTSYKVAKDAET